MKLGLFVSYFLLMFSFSVYGVTLPSESYVSPYVSPEETSIWGSMADENGISDRSQMPAPSAMMPAGEHGSLIWCPYCVGLWGYVDSDDYFACVEDPASKLACTDPDCEVHGSNVDIPLPISNSILPLLIFTLAYAIIRYRKLKVLKI